MTSQTKCLILEKLSVKQGDPVTAESFIIVTNP